MTDFNSGSINNSSGFNNSNDSTVRNDGGQTAGNYVNAQAGQPEATTYAADSAACPSESAPYASTAPYASGAASMPNQRDMQPNPFGPTASFGRRAAGGPAAQAVKKPAKLGGKAIAIVAGISLACGFLGGVGGTFTVHALHGSNRQLISQQSGSQMGSGNDGQMGQPPSGQMGQGGIQGGSGSSGQSGSQDGSDSNDSDSSQSGSGSSSSSGYSNSDGTGSIES